MSRATVTMGLGALVLGACGSARASDSTNRGRQLVEQMVQNVGDMAKLRRLKDVEYTYVYRTAQGKADVSTERYVFAGELSWARYLKREVAVYPKLEGQVVQAFDGSKTWATVDGKPITDPQQLKLADFLRKTNFYWFAMMQKLLDPGTHHRHKGRQRVGEVTYDVVAVTFGKGVGDVQDTYLLYINPRTHLVDQFLFTVMDFGMTKPYLMQVQYTTSNGIKLPATRRYAPADWKGNVAPKADWTEELMTEVRFDNKLARAAFQQPAQ